WALLSTKVAFCSSKVSAYRGASTGLSGLREALTFMRIIIHGTVGECPNMVASQMSTHPSLTLSLHLDRYIALNMNTTVTEEAEASAFIAWLATFPLQHPASALSDLNDGTSLSDVLNIVDPNFFPKPTTAPDLQIADNWPLRFTALKRLFRLITQYFIDILKQSPSHVNALEVPDLQKMARDGDRKGTLNLCRLCIAIAVMSARNQDIIAGIQTLEEAHQQRLMEAIALVSPFQLSACSSTQISII
ncbi:10286_t:CDS:2, partial [Acaulospora colombiana]